MFALETGLAPDAFAIAERVWAEPGAVLLWSADGAGDSFIGCWPSEERTGLDPEPSLSLADADFCDTRRRAPRWVGVLPYEAARERMERPKYRQQETRATPHHTDARWWRYPAFVCIGRRVSVVGDDPVAVCSLAERIRPPAGSSPTVRGVLARAAALERRPAQESAERHRERIARALELIREGEIYQVNLARRIDLDVRGSTLALLARLSRRAPARFCAAMEATGVVSTSPELCLRTAPPGRALTVPIKGTRPRGGGAIDDERQRNDLARDAKEHAELSMIVDVERNDLGRVAVVGSVTARAPEIVAHPTLFHRQATVSARIRRDVGRTALLQSMLPSGSVTGAPKVRAMELVATLEAERRGLYTGAFGMLRHDGSLELAMAIRTLTMSGGEAHYFVGGGIVLDSDPEREIHETEWKALQLGSASG